MLTWWCYFGHVSALLPVPLLPSGTLTWCVVLLLCGTWVVCVGRWPVQGIWPPAADGTDVNAVHRSPDNKLLATADDFGRVKLFRCVGGEQGGVVSV